MNYRLSDIAKITHGTLRGEDRVVREVVTDSRGSFAGATSLFVAMQGARHDSHNYLEGMAQRGVEAFMVERESVVQRGELSYLVVENSVRALQLLAEHHRAQFSGTVVGVTGSNGKTTVKEWAGQVAPEGVRIFRSPRSYNSQLGVALSLLMIEGDEDIAIIEAGISQRGEMERLERMIRPEIGVITSIGEAHAEGFESQEEKIEEKLKLFGGAREVIYSSDYSELIAPILYGVRGEKVDAAEFPAAEFGDIASRRNSQIVAALYHTLGLSAPRFEQVVPLAMRLEVVEGLGGSLIINDSYNNDINALAVALDSLSQISAGRKRLLILSDIPQSGVEGEKLYGRVAELVRRSGVERVLGVGREIACWQGLFSCEIKCYATTEELLANLSSLDYSSRAILLKGDRKSRFETLSHALARQSHTTTLEVDLDAMIHNLNHYRAQLTHSEKLCAMVKASSYGAGEFEVAQMLQHEGVDFLAVAFADEGARLRERGISMPIIVLNADDGSFSQMVDMRLEPEIYSFRSLRAFALAVVSRGEREYPIHIKLDSGMHRLGFMEHEMTQLCEELERLRGVVVVASIFSHLATADMGAEGAQSTQRQIAAFESMTHKIMEGVGYPTLRHLSNTAGISNYTQARFEMCRLGIGLYGFGDAGLRAVSTLKSRIVQIREIAEGEHVGYGGAGVTLRKSRIATIPIGYADGLNRKAGCGAWEMIIRGCRAKTIGRICMDSCMVDVTDIEGVEEGDSVVIFSGERGNTAEDMAELLGTISYEVLTSVSTRVKRIYLKE